MEGEAIDDFWNIVEQLIRHVRIEIDRPKGTAHPRYPEMVYPVDYGYLVGTTGTDGEGIDIFVGSDECGLCGHIKTIDLVKGDQEIKLLWNVSDDEIVAVERFLSSAGIIVRVTRRFPSVRYGSLSDVPNGFSSPNEDEDEVLWPWEKCPETWGEVFYGGRIHDPVREMVDRLSTVPFDMEQRFNKELEDRS